jgi:hypothetical protein
MWRRGHATAHLVLMAQFGDFGSRDGLAHAPQVDRAAPMSTLIAWSAGPDLPSGGALITSERRRRGKHQRARDDGPW